MNADNPQRRPLRARRTGMGLGPKIVLAVSGTTLLLIGTLLLKPGIALAIVYWVASSGTDIDVPRAREIVARQKEVLQNVLELAQQSLRPEGNAPAFRALAAELGALDIRFEDLQGGSLVLITFSRGGVAETYETQLTWAPTEIAERVRAGRYRLGEYFEYIDAGWWWVFW